MHWLQFIAYFLCMLGVFYAFWKTLDKAFDKIEERRAHHFEEKVDRYRRGHRS
jgi:hypothetical protein